MNGKVHANRLTKQLKMNKHYCENCGKEVPQEVMPGRVLAPATYCNECADNMEWCSERLVGELSKKGNK